MSATRKAPRKGGTSPAVHARYNAKRGPGLRPRLSPAAAEVATIYAAESLRAIGAIASEAIVWHACPEPGRTRGAGCVLCGALGICAECIEWDRPLCAECLARVVDDFRTRAQRKRP